MISFESRGYDLIFPKNLKQEGLYASLYFLRLLQKAKKMLRHVLLIIGLNLFTAIGADMKQDIQNIENLRAQYESTLMDIKGVTAVGTGLCKGDTTCLKIYTCIPIDQVFPLIPEELKEHHIELEFIGNIKTQY